MASKKRKCKNMSSKEYIFLQIWKKKERQNTSKKLANIIYLTAIGNRFAWSLKYEPSGRSPRLFYCFTF